MMNEKEKEPMGEKPAETEPTSGFIVVVNFDPVALSIEGTKLIRDDWAPLGPAATVLGYDPSSPTMARVAYFASFYKPKPPDIKKAKLCAECNEPMDPKYDPDDSARVHNTCAPR